MRFSLIKNKIKLKYKTYTSNEYPHSTISEFDSLIKLFEMSQRNVAVTRPAKRKSTNTTYKMK